MQESKMIQGLGGLRGIAIIAIFFYHLYPEILRVDLLECLSFSL